MSTKTAPKLAAAAGPSTESAAAMSAKELAASKRQKKREVDRRCQREARQRTKARISYLEELVDQLRQQDTSGQVASLMEQVAEARNERDQFARTLRGIEDSIRGHRAVLGGTRADSPKGREARDSTGGVQTTVPDGAISPSQTQHSLSFSASSPPMGTSRAAFGHTSTPALHHSDAYALTTPLRRDTMFSSSGACPSCDQMQDADPRPQSLWRFSNEVLNARPVLTAKELEWEDQCVDDTPVRALVEGWDATAQRLGGELPPLWRALRLIDERVFESAQPVERLAIMRTMHILYRYHADPDSQKVAVPSWFLARPSQNIEHSYAIDFFCWPGVRERFVFSEHSYCTDLFWHLLNKSLRILWQYDFRDCYTFNRRTGTYALSSAFQARISDINSWTMGPAFFNQWPELYADIPSFEAAVMPMDRLQKVDGKEDGTEEQQHASAPIVSRMQRLNNAAAIVNLENVDVDGADIRQIASDSAAITINGNGVALQRTQAEQDFGRQQQQRRAAHQVHAQHSHQGRHNVALTSASQRHQQFSVADLARLRGVNLVPAQNWMWLPNNFEGDATLDAEGEEDDS